MVSGRHNLRQTFGSRHLSVGAIPNSSPSWARSDSDQPNPRRRKIGQDTHAKASPPKVGGGRELKVFCYTRRGLIRRRSDFSILPLGEQCEVTPYKRGGVAFTLTIFANLRQLVYFDTWSFSIRPILRVVKATCFAPSFEALK
jgi:hypothetical protein